MILIPLNGSIKDSFTVLFKSFGLIWFFFNVFERILLYTKAALFDQQYSKNSNILKYCYN